MVNETLPNLSSYIPSLASQGIYATTGLFAGACVLPIEVLWGRFIASSRGTILQNAKSHASSLIGRTAVRFWIFDHAKNQFERPGARDLPTWVKGGISGATGGFAEICAQSLVKLKPPSTTALLGQTGRTFFGFATFTQLWAYTKEREMSRSFGFCWLVSMVAGTVSSGIMSRAEGAKGAALLLNAWPKGALMTGTTIAVQVTSCASILEMMNVTA